MRLQTYTLRVEAIEEDIAQVTTVVEREDQREDVLSRILPSALSEAEENLSDLLPEGYYVKIEEWDA